MTLSGAITPGLSGPGSDGNEAVPSISQSSSIWNVAIRLYNVIFRTLVGVV